MFETSLLSCGDNRGMGCSSSTWNKTFNQTLRTYRKYYLVNLSLDIECLKIHCFVLVCVNIFVFGCVGDVRVRKVGGK